MVSLKDIAQLCSVSTATVSKALNNQKDVGEETKARVQSMAKKMGYFPNAAARSLKTNRSYNLGVLFKEEAGSGLTHEYFSGILNGFKMQAESVGYDITFINTDAANHGNSFYNHCKYRNFDGVIVVCADFDDPRVTELLNSELSMVTIDYAHYKCTSVNSNNVKGIDDLVHYAYEQGHRKIAYIHGQSFSFATKERVTSFYRAMETLHLDIPDEYVREANYLKADCTGKITSEILDLKERPTCILFPDDVALIGGKNVIEERGMKIPDDISIAGYDGNQISQLVHPKITTIHQDVEVIGREAAKRLIRIIEKPRTTLVEQVVIEGQLWKGQSLGKVSVE